MPRHDEISSSVKSGVPLVAVNCEPIPTQGYVVPATPTVPVTLMA